MDDKLLDLENRLCSAVKRGRRQEINEILSPETFEHIKELTLNEYKFFLIGLNALLRKSAENCGVNAPYLIDTSKLLILKIEVVTKPDMDILKELTESYCLLVKNYSNINYSGSIKRAILKINSDLCADISLNALAKYNNMSAGYFSGLFKKETGLTLTDYVNHQRVEKAKQLLTDTNLKIGEVAKLCGISELNYFTKIFRRYVGLNPTEYRKQNRK